MCWPVDMVGVRWVGRGKRGALRSIYSDDCIDDASACDPIIEPSLSSE